MKECFAALFMSDGSPPILRAEFFVRKWHGGHGLPMHMTSSLPGFLGK